MIHITFSKMSTTLRLIVDTPTSKKIILATFHPQKSNFSIILSLGAIDFIGHLYFYFECGQNWILKNTFQVAFQKKIIIISNREGQHL